MSKFNDLDELPTICFWLLSGVDEWPLFKTNLAESWPCVGSTFFPPSLDPLPTPPRYPMEVPR